MKGLGNLAGLMKQAQEIGGRMQGMSDELRGRRATGSAGGGMVEVEANGLGELLACRIDPSLIERRDREMIEDLVLAAVNQALTKAKELHAEQMRSLTGGLQLPGLDEALAKLTGGVPPTGAS
ncbi:MAG: YbaB/EbfC family nucleoid-associated protein [Pirellulales bacterium]|nr:YbaB/EbfC family nucleoid-associated protein [Pirellulales bacterium]